MAKPKIPKYPFKRVGSAEKPTVKMLKSMNREYQSSGQGKTRIKPSRKFLARERIMADNERPVRNLRAPKWLLSRIARHAPVKLVVNDLVERLRRSSTEKNLRFTQAGFNELGRMRGGGKLIRGIVTQKLVDEFQVKGRK